LARGNTGNWKKVAACFAWNKKESANVEFYAAMRSAGKETPLDNRPCLTINETYYLNIITKLRQLTGPISIQDIAAYCSLFTVLDRARLYDIAVQINMEERNVN
jgi:hypothetical protein